MLTLLTHCVRDVDTAYIIRHNVSMSTTSEPTLNPYLIGNFAPVTEEVTAFDLPVIGELPL